MSNTINLELKRGLEEKVLFSTLCDRRDSLQKIIDRGYIYEGWISDKELFNQEIKIISKWIEKLK